MKKYILVVISLFISATSILSQEKKLTNQSVIEMIGFGFSETIIKMKITNSSVDFDTSLEELSNLRSKGISEEVISLMILKMEEKKFLSVPFYVKSFQIGKNKVVINDTIVLQKGSKLLVFVPYNLSKKFLSIEPKTGIFSLKNIGKAANLVGTGAMAVAVGSNSIKVATNAIDLLSKTQSMSYAIDLLEQIEELPISNQAKKLAGRNFEITDFKINENEVVLIEGTIDNKKFVADLYNALMLGELKIKFEPL